MLKIDGVTHWSIPVNDLEESERFYRDLLGLEYRGRLGNSHMSCFHVGGHDILLCERKEKLYRTPQQDNRLHHSFTLSPEEWEKAVRLFHERGVKLVELTYREHGFFTGRERYLGRRPGPSSTRSERDQLLAQAEVILGGWPFPLDLRARAPRLKWFHQRPAGASNLLRGDLWGSDVTVTTSRGYGNTRPMAEYVLACFLHFARGLHRATRDQQQQQFDHRTYRPIQ